MPVKQHQIQLYNDLDEVLNKPPQKMVRYGTVLLLLVIVMVCSISFTVNHEDIIECRATIVPKHFDALQSPPVGTTVLKYFLKKDTLLKKGDTIITVTSFNGQQLANNTGGQHCILAPYDCGISVKRIPEPGEELAPGTLLATVTGAQHKFDVKIEIPPAAAEKVSIGATVKIASGFNPAGKYATPVCTIISMPYFDSSAKIMVADARLEFVNKTNHRVPGCFIFKKTVSAAIVCGTKSLASGFLDF